MTAEQILESVRRRGYVMELDIVFAVLERYPTDFRRSLQDGFVFWTALSPFAPRVTNRGPQPNPPEPHRMSYARGWTGLLPPERPGYTKRHK